MYEYQKFGCIITDKPELQSKDYISSMKKQLIQNKVIVFRSIDIKINELIRFIKQIHKNNYYCKVKENQTDKEIFDFLNSTNKSTPPATDYLSRWGVDRWRVDDSWKEFVVDISCVQIVKSPKIGGEMRFVDLERVYGQLHEKQINFISKFKSPGWNADIDTPPMWRGAEFEHKSIRIHPETSNKSIFYNGQNTVPKDNDKWVEYKLGLLELFEKTENRFDIHLESGDVAIWDNRCVAHSITGGFMHGERLYNKIEIGKSFPIDGDSQ